MLISGSGMFALGPQHVVEDNVFYIRTARPKLDKRQDQLIQIPMSSALPIDSNSAVIREVTLTLRNLRLLTVGNPYIGHP
jgi:hypothetical protein